MVMETPVLLSSRNILVSFALHKGMEKLIPTPSKTMITEVRLMALEEGSFLSRSKQCTKLDAIPGSNPCDV